MKVVITGGAGFLGSRLAAELAARGNLIGPQGKPEKITEIVRFDIVPAAPMAAGLPIRTVAGSIADPQEVGEVLRGAASVFHLGAVVSGGAEADFDLGMTVNLDGTRNVFEACRNLGARPRVVFASSVAVFGGRIPTVVTDETPVTPETSYGAQKAMGELMISDFSRKGFLDGRALRLPTIVVRPGKPNLAASSFASGILREPLTGVEALCPVPASTVMPLMSPRRVVECFIAAHDMEASLFGASRAMTLPGLSATVEEMLVALERVAGAKVRARVRFVPDERIMRIVKTWPHGTDSALARRAGMLPNATIDELIRQFIADDLGGTPVL